MDILALHADRHPDKPALIEGERVWSWPEFVTRRNRLGHALLGLGLEPGAHVIVYATNSLEHYLAAAGARPAGLIPAPMNHRLVAEEVAYILEGTVELEIQGKPAVSKKAGEAFLIPAGTVHNAKNTGKAVAKVLGTYIVEKGKPLATPVK